MTALEAIEAIRTMRPGSIETVQQEQFIKSYCDTLWKNVK
jgi:atypical dual specificity phosphatase